MQKSLDTYGGHRDGTTRRSDISWYMGRYSFVNVHQDAKSKTQEHRKIVEITRKRGRRRKMKDNQKRSERTDVFREITTE